jgi:S-adenosylmethionine:tRNA ribosyltransferase-isomerase
MDETLKALWNYRLPRERIAQKPARPRSSSRLLVYDRETERIRDRISRDLREILGAGDLIVVNDARVIPARIMGTRERSGGKVEILLLESHPDGEWVGWVRSRRVLPEGERVRLRDGGIAVIGKTSERRERPIAFNPPLDSARLTQIGEMPTPPYIKKKLENPEDYQTIFATNEGAVAAPTAGLHFDRPLVSALRRRGVSFGTTTLILGPASFTLVREEPPEDLEVAPEKVIVGEAVCDAIASARGSGHRVLTVGTTVVRSLETAFFANGRLAPFSGVTRLAIQPGYRFRATDAVMTNFHLPRSTHLLLVAALIGAESALRVYTHAIREGYRFYSFGDALLVL